MKFQYQAWTRYASQPWPTEPSYCGEHPADYHLVVGELAGESFYKSNRGTVENVTIRVLCEGADEPKYFVMEIIDCHTINEIHEAVLA